MARTEPVRIPGAALGRTWLRMTSQCVAPTPNPPSRMPLGTERSASCVVMMMIGSTISAMVSPPASRLWPFTVPGPVTGLSSFTKTANPKIP